MTRIAIAGFQHETNTFAAAQSGLAGLPQFEMADSWPALLEGDAVVGETLGMNLPIAGFAKAAAAEPDVTLVPILWCAAEPSGPVTNDAFETISERILDGAHGAGHLDGIYLDLHGAMVTESFEDGEGELLSRLRQWAGPNMPIAVSLDLHANVTAEMVQHASAICIYRTYPHLDMAETGARCFPALKSCIAGRPAQMAFRQIPYLVPLHAQHTESAAAKTLYAELDRYGRTPGAHAEVALGFTASDIFDCGPSVVTHAPTLGEAEAMADAVLAAALDVEPRFDCALLPARDAVAHALAAPPGQPVVIADVQDNPGAGGTSDTTGLLRELVDQRATGAILGLMHDPALAVAAHDAGVGSTLHGTMGGRSGLPGERPFEGAFRVDAVSDGNCRYTGEMYGGGIATLGPSAALSVVGEVVEIRVVVTSIRNQCLDRAQFEHFGLQPDSARVVCVKSTAHFRADFESLAQDVLVAESPGAFPCALERVLFRKLRPGVRHGPMSNSVSGRESDSGFPPETSKSSLGN